MLGVGIERIAKRCFLVYLQYELLITLIQSIVGVIQWILLLAVLPHKFNHRALAVVLAILEESMQNTLHKRMCKVKY